AARDARGARADLRAGASRRGHRIPDPAPGRRRDRTRARSCGERTMSWLGSRGPAGSSRSLGPNVAGSWYPASATALASRVDALLAGAGAPPGTARDVAALIAPHAGFD